MHLRKLHSFFFVTLSALISDKSRAILVINLAVKSQIIGCYPKSALRLKADLPHSATPVTSILHVKPLTSHLYFCFAFCPQGH